LRDAADTVCACADSACAAAASERFTKLMRAESGGSSTHHKASWEQLTRVNRCKRDFARAEKTKKAEQDQAEAAQAKAEADDAWRKGMIADPMVLLPPRLGGTSLDGKTFVDLAFSPGTFVARAVTRRNAVKSSVCTFSMGKADGTSYELRVKCSGWLRDCHALKVVPTAGWQVLLVTGERSTHREPRWHEVSANCGSVGELRADARDPWSKRSAAPAAAAAASDSTCSACKDRCEQRLKRELKRKERDFDRRVDRGEVGLLDAFAEGIEEGISEEFECASECSSLCD
jgi:hypothetical protein